MEIQCRYRLRPGRPLCSSRSALSMQSNKESWPGGSETSAGSVYVVLDGVGPEGRGPIGVQGGTGAAPGQTTGKEALAAELHNLIQGNQGSGGSVEGAVECGTQADAGGAFYQRLHCLAKYATVLAAQDAQHDPIGSRAAGVEDLLLHSFAFCKGIGEGPRPRPDHYHQAAARAQNRSCYFDQVRCWGQAFEVHVPA